MFRLRNHILKIAAVVLCSPWQYFSALCQDKIRYDQFTSEEGLSENVVYCMHQDKHGFIWAGTDYGLNRFDGYQFKHYHRDNTDTSTLSGQSILCISEDESGKFWIGTHGGLNYFDPKTGETIRIHMPGVGLSYSVVDIHNLENGNLLLFSEGGTLHLYHILHRSFRRIAYPLNANLLGFRIFQFQDGRVGIPIINQGNTHSLALLNKKQDSLEIKTIHEILPFASERSINYYFRDGQDNHYVFSQMEHTFRVYNKEGAVVQDISNILMTSPTPIYIFTIEQVDAQHVWIGTNLGLIVFNNHTNQVSVPELVGDSRSLAGYKEIRYLLPDRSGNVWIGVFGEGLLKCDNRSIPFGHLILPEITHNKVSRMIFGLFAWQDDIVAAEINYYTYSLIKDRKPVGIITKEEMSLNDLVRIATGMSLEDLSPFQRTYFRALVERSKQSFPQAAFLPNDTTVLHHGLEFSVHTPGWDRVLVNERIKNVVEDEAYFWAAVSNGLHRIDKGTYADTVYRFEPGNPYSLSESTLYYVTMDDEKNLWIGTKGGGLNFFDRAQEKFFHYTTEDGLPDNVVYFILPDQEGNLWLTTNKGISRFDPKEKTFSNFTRRDGLLNAEFNALGGVVMPDGYMYFSGTNGIDYFTPGEVEMLRKVEAVHVSEWRANSVIQLPGPSGSLGFDQNNITLYFTTNDFIRPDLVYFRYKIHGDEPWTRVQGINFATYNVLRPDGYDFEVQASYDNLHWSKSAHQKFTIRAPWWMSWWFLALCTVAAVSGLYAFYIYRIEQLKRLQRVRTKISQDLHDEVGSTLSSIHVYSSVATKTLDTNQEATRDALRQIKQNSREVMENMSDIVWAINTGNNGEMSLERKLKNYGYELLTPLGIRCVYEIDKEAEKKLVHIEARKNILLIAKEAMNNMAKYSGATEATVYLGISQGLLQMHISDNGRGFKPGTRQSGNGLLNMQNRTLALGGEFQLETGEAQGTTIKCRIPIANIRDSWTRVSA